MKDLWNKCKRWLDKNFTWKGFAVGLFVLYQLIPDTSGRHAYWLSMYPQIRDFVLANLRIFVICIGTLLIWLDHRAVLAKRRPVKGGLKLTIETLHWAYDVPQDMTIFTISAFLVNSGAPTVAKDWRAEYQVNGAAEAMKGFYLIGPYTITLGNEALTIENKNLLNAQVLTNRLDTGDAKAGRIIFALKGNRNAQIAGLQFKIRLVCNDYADRPAEALFVPDPKPLDGIKMLPGELLSRNAANLQPNPLPLPMPPGGA